MEQITHTNNLSNDGYLCACDCECVNEMASNDKGSLNMLEISQAIQDLDSKITELEAALHINHEKKS